MPNIKCEVFLNTISNFTAPFYRIFNQSINFYGNQPEMKKKKDGNMEIMENGRKMEKWKIWKLWKEKYCQKPYVIKESCQKSILFGENVLIFPITGRPLVPFPSYKLLMSIAIAKVFQNHKLDKCPVILKFDIRICIIYVIPY